MDLSNCASSKVQTVNTRNREFQCMRFNSEFRSHVPQPRASLYVTKVNCKMTEFFLFFHEYFPSLHITNST